MCPHCIHRRAFVPLALALCTLAPLRADPIISEFMASNTKTKADVDGDFSDWIEIYNPDASAVNLQGWYLTDDATDKKKWQLPNISVAAGGYLLVWASGKDRNNPAKELHTNFSLATDGEYLGLIKGDGSTVASEFAPTYPPQLDDVSYGITQPTSTTETVVKGFFRTPTPGVRNGGIATVLLLEKVAFSRASGPFAGSFTLTMSGASAGQRIRYVVAAPSAAGPVVAEPTATSTEYTGPITVSSSALIRATVFSSDNVQSGFSTVAQYVRLANSGAARLDTFATPLPVIIIDTHGPLVFNKDDIEHPVWSYSWNRPATGNNSLTATPSSGLAATATVHGASSADFPKKSFNLNLSGAVPLIGLGKFKSWILNGPWNYDRTLLHNAFIYALSNKIGRWAPRTQFCEVFVNADGGDLDMNDYMGVYMLTDPLDIDPERVNLTALSLTDTGNTSSTGGYFFKVDLADPDELSFQTTRGFPGFPVAIVVDKPKLAGLATVQRTYIQNYVQGFEDALYANYASNWTTRTYLNYIKRAPWVDHHMLNVLTENVDAFQRSAYMMKDRSERIVAGPLWDFDRSMDGGEVRSKNPSIWSGPDGATPPWDYGWWAVLAHDPEFMQDWIDRWQSLRQTDFSTTSLNALVDSLAAQIGATAAARDEAKWVDLGAGGNDPRYGNWQGEIDHLKSWLATRTAWIDSQFVAPPTITTSGTNIVVTPSAGAQLAYTTDGTDPRTLGPALAPTATLSSTAITLAATTNVHARSFRASVDPSVVPGSQWSSAVGGPGSTAVQPRPFLANLSILTNLAADDTFTMGFVVGGAGTGGPKSLLARAAGPSLSQFGVGSPHPDPKLDLYAGSTKIGSNNDWGGDKDLVAAFAQVGAFPYTGANSKDAADYESALAAGNNSVIVSGASGKSGTVIAELYDATATQNMNASAPRLINVSVLKNIGDGLTVGFVIGPAGGPKKKVLVRAVGATLGLAPFNVPGVVADPQLTLFGPSGQIDSNNNWGGTAELTAAFTAVGAFGLPATSSDAALLATLSPGNYTVQVKGVNNTTGVALVEVYEVP